MFLFPLLGILLVLFFLYAISGSGRRVRLTGMAPRQMGSMGRPHQAMDPKAAASNIYGTIKARGGLQPGRVYSTSYFKNALPMGVGYADDWMWWQLVYSELNALAFADGFGYGFNPYMYGNDSSMFIGDPNDPTYSPQYYSDPSQDYGQPLDPGIGSVVNDQSITQDQGFLDQGDMSQAIPDFASDASGEMVEAGGGDWMGSDLGNTDLGSDSFDIGSMVDSVGDSFGGSDFSSDS
jgi:hypothetical protein